MINGIVSYRLAVPFSFRSEQVWLVIIPLKAHIFVVEYFRDRTSQIDAR